MDNQALFAIGEVSAIVGLSRHTIRAWERRHGLQPRRTATGQRRYTADDIALLLNVKHLVSRHRTSLKLAFGTAQGQLGLASPESGWSVSIWRSIADMLPQMIVVLDPWGQVYTGNRAASAAFGVPTDELCGRHLVELLQRGVDRDAVLDILRRTRERRTRFELELPTIAGRRRWSLDCRPFIHEGQPHLVLIGGPAVSSPSPEPPRLPGQSATGRQR
ncbi:MAG TPA: MerR family transcriptional regulator [Candidatus Dormibacteraeota bacterium]|nr:MerR family transcriptional regulator [Candidatus Dormibacteraeota bacterium]